MAATAVERPMTAQERVLSANNPPPRPPQHPQQSYHQRMVTNNRGTGVAAAFSEPSKPADRDSSSKTSQSRRTGGKQPSDFFTGPTGPGQIKHGVRRYEEKNSATVGLALTEDWIRGHGEDEPTPRHVVRQRGPKDNLEGPSCNIKTEEPKSRPMRAPGKNHNVHNRTAPFLETEVPQEPLPKEATVGKRRFQTRNNGDIISTPVPEQHAEQEETDRFGDAAGHASYRRNKANESRDVLNLGRYSAEQLLETERKVVLGPREFTPQDLPPRQRPIIARVKSAANETHDIFGTGQGAKGHEAVHGKRRGTHAPKSSSHVNLFDDTPPPPRSAPAKPYRPSNLLDYAESEPRVQLKPKREEEVPAATATSAQRQPAAKVESGSLFTPSKKSEMSESHRGRARGACPPKDNHIF